MIGYTALCYLGVAHHTVRILVINASTVFLNFRRIDFGVRRNFFVDVAFIVSFFVLRIVLLPKWWIDFLRFAHSSDTTMWGECMNESIVLFAFIGGIILHSLNAYWFVLILRSVNRRRTQSTGVWNRSSVGKTSLAED